MKHLLIALTLVFSFNLFAASCVENASDSELLREIERRMSGGTSTTQNKATFSCDASFNLRVTLVNLDSGNTGTYAAYSNQCNTDQIFFNSKLGAGFSGGKLLAWCDASYNLIQLLLSGQGNLKEVSKSYSGNCQSEANAINAKL